MMCDEKTVGTRPGFDGKLLKVEVLDVELPSGRQSVREVVRHPGSAVVLPQLPDGRFVLVRQFRKALERYILEAVAGTVDPGETPRECAVRELREETGYEARELRELGTIYPSPGYTDEIHHIFYAILDPERGAVRPDDDEKLESVWLEAGEIERMTAAGELHDAKTLATWLLYKSRGGGEPTAGRSA